MRTLTTAIYARQKKLPSLLLTNLVAYYKLNGNVLESTGLSPNGSASSGVDYVAGKTGNAARFDATGDIINVVDNSNFSFTTGGGNDVSFSIGFWVYFTGFSSVGNFLVSKRNDTSANDEYSIVGYPDGIQFLKMSSSGYQYANASTTFVLNTWYFIVSTDNGSKTGAGMNISINNVDSVSSTATSGTYAGMANGMANLTMGNYVIAPAVNQHLGYIEDVGIWKNRVLNSTEINQLYNAGNGITYPF